MQIADEDLASLINTLHYHLRSAAEYACIARVLRAEPGRYDAYADLLREEMLKVELAMSRLRPHLPLPIDYGFALKPASVQVNVTTNSKEAA